MQPDNISNVNAFGYALLAIMSAGMLLLPRKYALLPIYILTGYMTLGQNLNVAGLNFSLLRIILLFGWIRLFFRGEYIKTGFNILDKIILIWLVSNCTLFTLHNGTTAALINRLGYAYNAIGLYFMFRSLICNSEDINRTFKILAIVIFPLAIAMSIEMITKKNPFSLFGGVPSEIWMRGGSARCQGPFLHPILAGLFGATMTPYFFTLWHDPNHSKKYAIIGCVSGLIITLTSHSSAPLISLLVVVFSLMLWSARNHMKFVRWSIVVILAFLHVSMNAPVWYLMSKASNVTGGTGWHRSYLIDQSIYYFNEWWLMGTSYTAHWMPYVLSSYPEMSDITNQFIFQGVQGGLVTMILFLGILVVSYKIVGRSIKITGDDVYKQRILWGLGSALTTHVVAFFSVTYFDQIVVVWYLLLAMIATFFTPKVLTP